MPNSTGVVWKPRPMTKRPSLLWSVLKATFENGILTASEDQNIWTEKVYDNFILDLEFQVADGTNSGWG